MFGDYFKLILPLFLLRYTFSLFLFNSSGHRKVQVVGGSEWAMGYWWRSRSAGLKDSIPKNF
jgi:hypothetical protein